MNKDMIELISNIESIGHSGNYVEITVKDITKATEALKKLGVDDIAETKGNKISAVYHYSKNPKQKSVLFDIQMNKERFDALWTLNLRGGINVSKDEAAWFTKYNKIKETQLQAAAKAFQKDK